MYGLFWWSISLFWLSEIWCFVFRCLLECFRVTINMCAGMKIRLWRSSTVCTVWSLLVVRRFVLEPKLGFCSILDFFSLFLWMSNYLCCGSNLQTRFIVMGNLFCSEYRIHRRFDLKGSSHGRTTDKSEGEIDETTTLKDLDLNFVFRLQQNWFQELMK